MPDGKEILFSAKEGLWRLATSGAGTPTRLPFVGEDGIMPVVSRPQPGHATRLVYVRSFEDSNIWRVETAGAGVPASSPPAAAVSSTRWDGMAQLSHDGRHVAFSSSRSGEWEIWLADPDGANWVPLTSRGAAATGAPRWSRDGQMIAYHSSPEGQAEIFMVPSAGGKPRNLTSDLASDAWPAFSRDSKWIYFNSNRTGERQIWKIPTSGGRAVQLTTNGGYASVESLDGAYLYYNQTMEVPGPLWRIPTSGGGAPVKVLDGLVRAAFAVTEQGIYYIDRPSGEGGIYSFDRPSGETRLQYFNLATRRSITVARNLGNVGTCLTATSDGRTILYSRIDSSVDDLMLVENFR
jgi:Tol biopolymer transport system component